MKKLFKNVKSSNGGFTLVELIVVIAIIGILAAVMLPKFAGFSDKAREKTVMSQAKNIYTACETIYAEKGAYPTAQTDVDLAKYVTFETGDTLAMSTGTTDDLFTFEKTFGTKKISVVCKKGGKIAEPTATATPKNP